MEIEKGFGAGVAVPEPVGWGEVPVACHSGLENFASFPWASNRISLTSTFVGSFWSWSSASWIFLAQDLTRVPWVRFFSFAKRVLHWFTLFIAASSHSAYSRPLVGHGVSPDQASNSSILLFSSLSKVALKKREGLFGGGWCPQIVIMSGE